LAQNLPKLVYLDVSWCGENISEGTAQKFAKGCHKLQYLGLADSKVTESALLKVVQGCPSLSSLDVAYCSQLNISNAEKFVKHVTGFQRLIVTGVSLTEASLIKLIEAMPDLRELDISNNELLREQFLLLLLNNPAVAKNLRQLTIGQSKHINSKIVSSLLESRANLSIYYFALSS